jgi:hypothetical protein
MNTKIPTFGLHKTTSIEVVITSEIARLLVLCIKHALATNTKHFAYTDIKLGDHGAALIRALKEEYNLSLPDARDNARRMVGMFGIEDLPHYDWTADREAAIRVLDHLRALHQMPASTHFGLVERIRESCR